jgi:hypothetical protein
MEFFDEESRPKLQFQSRARSESKTQLHLLHKPTIFISLSISLPLFILSFLYLHFEPLSSIILWFALSFLLGPFAPPSLTAGDIRVGLGPLIQPPLPVDEQINPNPPGRRSKSRRHEDLGLTPIPVTLTNGPSKVVKNQNRDPDADRKIVGEDKDWSEADLDLLKKQMVKFPVGMPGRWEAIAEAFGGRHGAESVIKAAKFSGGKKMGDADSFSRFLKDRKPVDKRVEDEIAAESGEARKEAGCGWSSGEDIALLNALKAFPKEAPMRWEKITAAVPGRSKAACMKRVSDLKKDFRSNKASTEA